MDKISQHDCNHDIPNLDCVTCQEKYKITLIIDFHQSLFRQFWYDLQVELGIELWVRAITICGDKITFGIRRNWDVVAITSIDDLSNSVVLYDSTLEA